MTLDFQRFPSSLLLFHLSTPPGPFAQQSTATLGSLHFLFTKAIPFRVSETTAVISLEQQILEDKGKGITSQLQAFFLTI